MKDDGNLQQMLEYLNEMRNPIYHLPTNLGINEFKRVARGTSLSKSAQNKLIKAYKKRSWMEWTGVTRMRGTFPTHPHYGKGVKVDIEEETTVKVKINGK